MHIIKSNHFDHLDHLDHLNHLDHLDHVDYLDQQDQLVHLDDLDHVDHPDHLNHLTSDHPTNQIPVQPSQVKYSSRAQYIPVQPVILLNVVKSVTLSSLSETA